MLRALSIDPLNIASNAAVEVSLLTGNLYDSISLNLAVSRAESVVSHVNSVLSTYATEASTRWTYYENKKNAYEAIYGSVDPNVKPNLSSPNNCIRGDACTSPLTSNPSNSEEHQLPCPQKIDGWFFGVGERDCPGHIYSCDTTYQCSDWADHLQNGSCGHRYENRYIDSHRMLMPGPCSPTHDYYACNTAHELVEYGSCGERRLARIWTIWGYDDVYVGCIHQSSYYKCIPHTHIYPTQNSSGYSYYYY